MLREISQGPNVCPRVLKMERSKEPERVDRKVETSEAEEGERGREEGREGRLWQKEVTQSRYVCVRIPHSESYLCVYL